MSDPVVKNDAQASMANMVKEYIKEASQIRKDNGYELDLLKCGFLGCFVYNIKGWAGLAQIFS